MGLNLSVLVCLCDLTEELADTGSRYRRKRGGVFTKTLRAHIYLADKGTYY
jgi:hypothetical protein